MSTRRAATALRAVFLAVTALATACARPLPQLAPSMIAEPAQGDVESVVYLFGDAGYADERTNPVLRRLFLDIEHWSAAVARDSAVVVLFLGDIVYPRGLHPPGVASYERDSATVQSQVNLLAGPAARAHRTAGYFLAGNHDWGNARHETGVAQLQNLEQFLDRQRSLGINVSLRPAAGLGGPSVVDLGTHARLLLFDTAWWLLSRDGTQKRELLQRTQAALRDASGRFVIAAAHHPFQSASSHGGLVPFWRTFGLRFLLARSGAMLQDLNSIAYRELLNTLMIAFREGPPLIFAGGHDHALQVIANDSFPLPRFSVVSGSGSKVSGVGHMQGMLYRREAPGYMRVVTHRSGRVDLFVIAAPDRDYLTCGGSDAMELERCMATRSARFTTRYGLRLR